MFIIITKNYKEMSKRAANIVIDKISKKPTLILGLPTGETPLGMYTELIKAYKKKKVNFSKIKTFNLDEYYPIKNNNENSYHYYMNKNLFDKINIKKKNINILNGEAKNWKKECSDYEKKIKKNPIDLMILGVGINGHIGFNEPGSLNNSKTRMIQLSDETRKINKTKNIYALTIGIFTIMSAKKIILLANGKNKAKAIKRLIEGPINKDCPVSFLRKHKNLIVILDKEAASLLKQSS